MNSLGQHKGVPITCYSTDDGIVCSAELPIECGDLSIVGNSIAEVERGIDGAKTLEKIETIMDGLANFFGATGITVDIDVNDSTLTITLFQSALLQEAFRQQQDEPPILDCD